MTLRAALFALALALLGYGYVARPADPGGVRLRDFEAYYAAGATWHYHGDPFGRDVWRTERTIPGVVATHDELLPFVGPPFGLPLWEAFARLSWTAATGVWAALLGAAFVAVALASARRAEARLLSFESLCALLIAATFAPLTSAAALGQVALLSCAAVVLWPAALATRTAYPAAFGALVAALQPNLGVVLAARLAERRSWIAAATAGAVALGGSALAAAGIGGLGGYLAVLRDHAAAERGIAIQTTVGAVARGLGAAAPLANGIAIAVACAVVAAVALQCRSGRYAPDDRLALACAAAPLALPFAHEHDFCIAFLPALAVARRARGLTWLAGTLGAVAISVDWPGLVQRSGDAFEAAPFAAACALGLILLSGRLTRGVAAVPVIAALGVAIVALPAAAHPLPTWPLDLPAAFSVSHTVAAAEVWHLEQVASGIARLDPYWAALRALSLAGCAALWFAASVALRRPIAVDNRIGR